MVGHRFRAADSPARVSWHDTCSSVVSAGMLFDHFGNANDNSSVLEYHMSKVGIRPLGEKVLVKRLEAEETTSGGIVLPDSAKEKPKRGTVLSVGDGKLLDSGKRKPLHVKAGDQVLFTSYAGTEIKVEGEEMLIMDEGDILAVLK